MSVTAGVSSLRVSWNSPAGPVHGGYVAESYDAAQDGEGTPFAACETALDVHSCVLAAEPGRSYRVVVIAGGGRASAPATSGVVAFPPVPAQLPASSGALRVTAGGAGALTAGDAVDVAGSGYLPDSTVTVVVYSTPTVLDSLVTNADGSFDTNVTLPADLPAGAHTLVATGVAPDGGTWTLTQPITARTAAGPAAGGLAYTGRRRHRTPGDRRPCRPHRRDRPDARRPPGPGRRVRGRGTARPGGAPPWTVGRGLQPSAPPA